MKGGGTMAAIQEALDILQEEDYKLTDKRKELLLILSAEDRYLSAREIHEKMKVKFPAISIDTIYRNLKTFHDLSLLEETKWENERIFRYTCGVEKHHHHFICKECGKSEEIMMCPMDQFRGQLPHYEIEDHRFEIFGRCPDCST